MEYKHGAINTQYLGLHCHKYTVFRAALPQIQAMCLQSPTM